MDFHSPYRSRRQFNTFANAAPSRPVSWRGQPLVSVVLPVYNHARYLGESVASVLKLQQYPVELLVIDDGSTDDPQSALGPYLNDPRLKFLRQENAGLARTLDRGFASAAGSFVTWTSADNRFKPGAIPMMVEFLLENPKIGLVYANVELIDEEGEPFTGSHYRIQDQLASQTSRLLLPLSAETLESFGDNFINACFLFRSELIPVIGPHRRELLGFEDYDYWLRLSRMTQIAHIDTDDVLYEYRLHPSSLTSQLDASELAGRQRKHVQAFLDRTGILTQRMDVAFSSAAGGDTTFVDRLKSALHSRGVLHSGKSGLKLDLKTLNAPRALRHSGLQQVLPWGPYPIAVQFTGQNRSFKQTLLPPVSPPATLTRARDCCFDAVTPPAGAAGSALVLTCADASGNAGAEEKYIAELAALAASVPELCLVLFASNAEERKVADRVNTALRNNANLRIIDVSTADEDPLNTSGKINSLMYALSSVQLLLTVQPAAWTAEHAALLQAEAGVAAASGLPLVCLCADQAPPENFLPAPHTGFAALPSRSAPGALKTLLTRVMHEVPNQNSLAQWLECAGPQAIVSRVHHALALLAL